MRPIHRALTPLLAWAAFCAVGVQAVARPAHSIRHAFENLSDDASGGPGTLIRAHCDLCDAILHPAAVGPDPEPEISRSPAPARASLPDVHERPNGTRALPPARGPPESA